MTTIHEVGPNNGPVALPKDFTGDYNYGLYTSETTKRYLPGTRHVTWDGRVFRYGLSGSALRSDRGAYFTEDEATTYSTISVANIIGDTKLHVTAVNHAAAIAKDELLGGFALVFGDGGDEQFRQILGNDASAIDATITNIILDGPLVKATTAATTGVELFYNPYASISGVDAGGPVDAGKCGIPARAIAASGSYFWLQTWGPCFVAPQLAAFQAATSYRAGYWRHDGSIDTAYEADYVSSQYAGYFMGEGLTSGPLFFLMCST